jgi:hypothetical protein
MASRFHCEASMTAPYQIVLGFGLVLAVILLVWTGEGMD